jgi:hypothetical protein
LERLFVATTIGATVAGMSAPLWTVTLGAGSVPASVGTLALSTLLAWRRLPRRLDGTLRRHTVRSLAWGLLALLTVVQTARLAQHVVDPSSDWWHTTQDEFWSRHSCMSAYFYAADLNRQGEENVYDADLYPVLNPDAENRSQVQSLAPEDPYQYPPQFLLVPRLALALSNDYRTIQAWWFTLQALLFVAAMLLLARWFGGSRGEIALWLMPLVWISVPSILNFQYGQFHVTTIVLAVAAFLAIENRRSALGGGLLAAAILAKGFPAILVLPLISMRRWRALVWTGIGLVGLTGLAVWVLGWSPFEAFLQYHLPRLQNGTAFAFDEVWPEWKAWLLAGNISPFSSIRKLAELGILPVSLELARLVHTLFCGALLLLALFVSWNRPARERAILWMALLNLAAFTPAAAWGDYVAVGTLWMAVLLIDGSTRQRLAMTMLAAFCSLLPGIVAIGRFPSGETALSLSLVGTMLLLASNVWVVGTSLSWSTRRASQRRLAFDRS